MTPNWFLKWIGCIELNQKIKSIKMLRSVTTTPIDSIEQGPERATELVE